MTVEQERIAGTPAGDRASSAPTLDELVAALGLQEPTDEQAAVAQYPPTGMVNGVEQGLPLLVVAGAGSGKTETLSLRATFLSAHYGIPGESILGLTFTRKAAGELAHRLRTRLEAWGDLRAAQKPLSEPAREAQTALTFSNIPEATTYNAFALSIVQEFGARAGLDPQISHLGEAAAWQLMSEVVAAWEGDLPKDEAESSVVNNALGLRDAIANQALTLREAEKGLKRLLQQFHSARAENERAYTGFFILGEETVRQRLELLKIIEEFDRRKSELGQMDYADQVIAALRIVKEVPEVREELRRRYRIVFLDEFQDTSVAQMKFLSALFANHPVTAVGDPNQAIYGWRGASAASLEDFHQRFSASSAPRTVLNLSTAWRNDQAILRAANVLAQPLATPPNYTRVAGAQSGGSIALPKLQTRNGAGLGSSEAVFTTTAADALRETVDFVVASRRKYSQDGGLTPASVAVLSRTRSALQPVVAALREHGVPAQVVGGDSLLGHPVIKDLRAVLEITADVGRATQLLRLLAGLDLGSGDYRALGNFSRRAARRRSEKSGEREASVLLEAVEACAEGVEVTGLSTVGARRVALLGARLRELRLRNTGGLSELVQEARSVMGLDQEAAADPTSEDATAVLDVFADVALTYEREAERPTMDAFLAWLDATEEKERGLSAPSVDIDPNAVQVMTIHASKGLEWDAVALVDVASSRFPLTKSRGSTKAKGVLGPPVIPAPQKAWWGTSAELPYPLREDSGHLPNPEIWDASLPGGSRANLLTEEIGQYLQDEERRLAYVAVTRARRALLIVGSWFGSGSQPRYPSVFMAELFESTLEEGSWKEFLDTREHRVAPVTKVRAEDITEPSAPAPALTGGRISALPPQDNWPSLVGGLSEAQFPRDPGPVRRQSEQAAARVGEELRALSSAESDRSQHLAGLADQDLATAVGHLLTERDHRTKEFAGGTLTPREVIAEVSKSRAISVTELAGFHVDEVAGAQDMIRPVPQQPSRSARVGTLLHGWIEQRLRRLSTSAADTDHDEEVPVGGALSPEDSALLEQLKKSAAQLDFSGYTVVAVEVPFTVSDRGTIVRGRIDAVLQDELGNYHLIDWKTASRPRNTLSPEDRVRYGVQLEYYREAWASTASAEGVEVDCSLVFIYPGGTWTVPLSQLAAGS
ncbi:ATP-dependent DNA helicase [Actinomyces minihominis]|uniref:ATP-dependent DNA helicase n=1 Tax=Actinomyces minihominis TaxID=2002838 RepID=UPI00101AE823|nr:ATP-dependent DNA helicase [Actinomyces minihominis]